MKKRRREKTNTCCHSRLHYWIWRWSCWIANEQLLKLRKTMLVQRRCCWSWSCCKLRWEEVHDGRCRGWCWTAAGVEEVTLAAGEEMHCQCRRWWMLQMLGGGSRFFFRFLFVCMAGSWCEQKWVSFFFFITSEGRLIGPVSLDWYYSSYRSDHSVKIIFLKRKIRNKVNSTHVICPLFYFFNIKQNISFLIKKQIIIVTTHYFI